MTKEISRLLLMVVLLTIFTPAMADELTIKTTRKLVVLDPGHGGNDHGIISATGILEKQIVLKLALMTAQMLGDQYRSLLTRTTDTSLSETDRTAFANHNKADLFLSLHLHTKKNKSFFFYFDTPDTAPANSSTSWRTQGLIHQDKSRQGAKLFAKIFQELDKGTRPDFGPAPAIPLEGLQMTAILAEPFTISDIPETTAELSDFLAIYAKRLARSIEAYLENKF
ncbi:MAG: N-acetylmuramoyl-L-alanine amidase [Desulfobacteraceae bacterium]|nr:N-acetylmuramoyl-L-alanine amidase [Desulfobacteraceae bacterium]